MELSSKFSRRDFRASVVRQHFSLPENIIYYISMNPKSAKVYEKLIQTCKYFFNKNPIIVGDRMFNHEDVKHPNQFKMILAFWEEERNEKTLDIKKFNVKFWIKSYLDISDLTDRNTCSLLISKIYRCNIYALRMVYQNISMDEYKILTASGTIEDIHFQDTIVSYPNGKIVPLETIFEQLPKINAVMFYNDNQAVTSETTVKLAQLPQMSKLERFSINNLPGIFDLDTFFANLGKPFTTEFDLSYVDSISDELKEKLQNFVNKLLETGLTESGFPLIYFPGQTQESLKAMKKIKIEHNLRKYSRKN